MFEDIKSIYKNDPIVKNIEFLFYPGLHAIVIHRYVSHLLYKIKIPFIPRLISQIMRFLTRIEINLVAKIGRGFFINHGMWIVIGGTVEIGKNYVIFHRVTLGGRGKHKGKRLIRVGDNVKIGANTTIINKNVLSNCTIVETP